MNWLNLTSLQAISVLPVLNCLFFFGGLDTTAITGSWLTAYLTKFVMGSRFFWHHERGGYREMHRDPAAISEHVFQLSCVSSK